MNRFFLVIVLLVSFGTVGCTKKTEPATQATPSTSNPPEQMLTSGRCSTQTVSALLADIQAQETAKGKLDQIAKASPLKENFKKVYAAELEFIGNTENAIQVLSHCEATVSTEVIESVKKKVATSRTNVDYLAESFPDFK